MIRACTALAVAACLLVAAASALAAPAWRIESLANTTAQRGGMLDYIVQVTNVGDAPADGGATPIVLTAMLPAGLTFVSASATGGLAASSCSGTTTVTCADTTDVVGTSPADDFGVLIVTVAVGGDASGTLTSAFAISGGDPSNPAASTVDPTVIADASPTFGVDAFDGQIVADAAGTPFTQAAGHPFTATTWIDFATMTNPNPLIGELWPVEATKDVVVDLPPGFVGSPAAIARCSAADLSSSDSLDPKPLCSPASQIGTALVHLNGLGATNTYGPLPVFNMETPPDVPARFGFNVLGVIVTMDGTLRSGSDDGLTVRVRNLPQALPVAGASLTLWGVPADSSHDAQRACAGQSSPWFGGPSCPTDASRVAFLRMPTSCTAGNAGLPTLLHIDSWVSPGRFNADGMPDLSDPAWKSASFDSHDPPAYPHAPEDRGEAHGPDGCESVPFDPALSATPASPAEANAPSGFTFDLKLAQSSDPDAIGTGDLKKAEVTLPEGMSVSPSSAQGLGACAPAEIGLRSSADPSCPASSKIGTVRIETPLLEQPMTGSIYLAKPQENPFGSLLALYLVARGPGTIVKLAGRIEADASSGRLTATFDENPQLPFSELQLDFKGGPRAPLVTPPACGTYTTHAVMTSWSGKTVSSDSSFTLDHGPGGGPCPSGRFAPGFSAGTVNPVAGQDSPFVLRLTREDLDQRLGALTVDVPSGLTGRIANAVLCPEGAANAGACTEGSQVGTVVVGAGAGSNPFYITNGRAFITGPYKGAPFGLAIVVPAVAGPFDLGNVIVRAAIFVDRATARLRVVSDPLPTILQGIPLDLRDVRVTIDRDHFIVNPTSCAEKHVFGTISSAAGAIAHGSTRFQVGECAVLPLAPKLTLTVGGRHRTRANGSTPFTATLTQTPGQTNLRAVTVTLPTTLNARLAVLNRACTQAQLDAGRCSAARAGSAVAVTPLLRDPLRGSAFFVKSAKRVLPDLVVALRGQVAVDLVGKLGVNPRTNQLTTTFGAIPDVPIARFSLRLVAGANGPLGTTTSLCAARARRATARIGFRAQNGKRASVRQRLRILGCPRRGKSS